MTCTRAYAVPAHRGPLPSMIEQGSGVIIHISSIQWRTAATAAARWSALSSRAR